MSTDVQRDNRPGPYDHPLAERLRHEGQAGEAMRALLAHLRRLAGTVDGEVLALNLQRIAEVLRESWDLPAVAPVDRAAKGTVLNLIHAIDESISLASANVIRR